MKQVIPQTQKLIILYLCHFFFALTNAAYPPFGLIETSASIESFSIRWESFNEKLNRFIVRISPLNDGESIDPTQHVMESQVEWNGLLPGKTYSVEIASEAIDGSVSPTSSINVTTIPAAPYDVRISKFVNPILTEYEVDANRTMMYAIYGAVVMWSGPDVGFYDGYKVSVSPPDGMVRLPIELNGGEPVSQIRKKRRIVWDLVPGVYYEFHIRATSNNKLSEAVTSGERMPPEIPCPIEIDSISPTSVTLSWNHRPHRGIVDGYVVEIDPRDGMEIDPDNSTDKGRQFINLTPGTIYNVEVYSSSSGILSFQPRTKLIKTPPHSPVGPIYASNVSHTSVTVHWEWPIGNTDYYEVVYFPTHRDYGRLRHRVFNLSVHLTSLEPDTRYSLILYAVSNGIYSKPLHAQVWTKPLNATIGPHATATQNTTTTASATIKDEYENNATGHIAPLVEKILSTKPVKGTISSFADKTEKESLLFQTSEATISTKSTQPVEQVPTIQPDFKLTPRAAYSSGSGVYTTSDTNTNSISLDLTTTDELDVFYPDEFSLTTRLPSMEIDIEAVPPPATDEPKPFPLEHTTEGYSNTFPVKELVVRTSTTDPNSLSTTALNPLTTTGLSKTTTSITKTTSQPATSIFKTFTRRESELVETESTATISKSFFETSTQTESELIKTESTTTSSKRFFKTSPKSEQELIKTHSTTTKSTSKNMLTIESTDKPINVTTTPQEVQYVFNANTTLLEQFTKSATTIMPKTTTADSKIDNTQSTTKKQILLTPTKSLKENISTVNLLNTTTELPFAKTITVSSTNQPLSTDIDENKKEVTTKAIPTQSSESATNKASPTTSYTTKTLPTTNFINTNSITDAVTSTTVESKTATDIVGTHKTKIIQEITTLPRKDMTSSISSTMPMHNWSKMKMATTHPTTSNLDKTITSVPTTITTKTVISPNTKQLYTSAKLGKSNQTTDDPDKERFSSPVFTSTAQAMPSTVAAMSTTTEPTPPPLDKLYTSERNVINTLESTSPAETTTLRRSSISKNTNLTENATVIHTTTDSANDASTTVTSTTMERSGILNTTTPKEETTASQPTTDPANDASTTVILTTTDHTTTETILTTISNLDPTTVPLVSVKPDATPTSIAHQTISIVNQTTETTALGSGEQERVATPKPPRHIRDGFTAICKPNNFTILVDKELIGEYERNYGPLYLSNHQDEKCRAIEHPTYYRYTIAPNILDCGTRMELNETHVNFTNTLSNSFNETKLLQALAKAQNGIIVGNKPTRHLTRFLHVRMWCTFPLDLNVSTLFPFLPQLTLQFLTFNVSGVGQFSAVMQLYRSRFYKEAYPAPPRLNITDTLYVGINLLDVENDATFVMVKRCWGTPVRSPNHPGAYPIIEDGCPINGSLDGTVRIIENGEGTRVKWEGSVFKFLDYDEVWLHCEIKVCVETKCKQTCNESRKKRSVRSNTKDEKVHVISAGPVVMIKTKSALLEQPISSTQSTTTTRPFSLFLDQTTILILAIAVSVTIMVSCIALSCAVIRHRRQKPRYKPSPLTSSFPVTSSSAPTRSSRFLNPNFKSDDDYLLTSTSWNIRPTDLSLRRQNVSCDWTLIGSNQLPDKKMNSLKATDSLPPFYYERNATLCRDELVSPSDASETSHISLYSAKTPSAVVTEDGIAGQFTQVM